MNFQQLIKSCGTLTNSAAETKSIGLPADAQVVMVFALHLDNFIMTRNLHPSIGITPSGQIYLDTKPSSIYRDSAKTHANPDTDGTSLNRRAVSNHSQCDTKSLYITVNQCFT